MLTFDKKQLGTKKRNILIVGASGFVGSNLTTESCMRGLHVYAGVRPQTDKTHLSYPNVSILEFDYSNKEQLISQLAILKNSCKTLDYLVYNAGLTKALNKDDFERVNYLYFKNFIEALTETNIIPSKLIYISSLSVLPDKNGSPLSVEDIPNPDSLYGQSKLKAEGYLRKQADLPYIILRPTGIYGPGEKDYYLMFKSARKGFSTTVGKGKQILSFIYIKDLTDAIFLALESNIKNKTYLLSDGQAYTDTDFIQLLKQELNKSYVLNLNVPLWLVKVVAFLSDFISRQTGKAYTINNDKYKILKRKNWECDTTPIQQELGFKAKYDLRKGIIQSIDWYKKNKWL